MILTSDLKDYIRDLLYTEEDVLRAIERAGYPRVTRERLKKLIIEKQVLLTQLVDIINSHDVERYAPYLEKS